MAEHRILDNNGQYINFTCQNYHFETNIDRGYAHSPNSTTLGSFYDQALLINENNDSLWLEHVRNRSNDQELFWLMWYNSDGVPIIPMSSVFTRADFEQMLMLLPRLGG